MDIKVVQEKLQQANYYSGSLDGDLGPQTYFGIINYGCSRSTGATGLAIARAITADFNRYGITTGLRIAHFLGQAAVETAYFQYLTELGGPAYFQKYEGRRDLGNTQPGDGFKFRGRGVFQITGRANYTIYGQRLGLDLVGNPDLAAQPETATLTACLFWADHGLNEFADADDCNTVTRRINGGTNGLADRQRITDRLKGLLS